MTVSRSSCLVRRGNSKRCWLVLACFRLQGSSTSTCSAMIVSGLVSFADVCKNCDHVIARHEYTFSVVDEYQVIISARRDKKKGMQLF